MLVTHEQLADLTGGFAEGRDVTESLGCQGVNRHPLP